MNKIVASVDVASTMSLAEGMVVQELGWDSDADNALRESIMDAIDGDLIEDADEAVDLVMMWWRADDGDVADGLVDALTDLAKTGVIWLLTPKVGRDGHVDPADIDEGVQTAGLVLTSPVNLSLGWTAQKVLRQGNRR